MSNHQSSIVNRQFLDARHFAWELFSAGSLVKKDGKTLYEVPVAVCGAWVKDGHTFTIRFEDLQAMLRNFEKRKNEMVVIDYEHASEDPSVARGGPVPAAGWIHELQVSGARGQGSGQGLGVRGQGLGIGADGSGDTNQRRGTDPKSLPPGPRSQAPGAAPGPCPLTPEPCLAALVEWTPEAKELIRGGQYRFFSPSIDWGARDKETGKPQGATLTSGALTNHPFLEELPPLMLTDLGLVVGAPLVGARALSEGQAQGLAPHSEGETDMEPKRLSIRMLTEGPHAGHHGIFYGDDLVGYMTDEDFCHYAQKHLAGAVAQSAPAQVAAASEAAALSELFAERVGAGGAAIEDIRGLVEYGRNAQARDQEAASRALILSEVVRDGRLRVDRALELARDQKISLADYVAVQAAERALDGAVAAGKILPRDRHFFFRDALERPREFSEYVERAAVVVRLGSDGIGSGESVPVDQEVDMGARRLMSEQKISYGKALKALFRENPALEARYRAAHRPELKPEAEPATQ